MVGFAFSQQGKIDKKLEIGVKWPLSVLIVGVIGMGAVNVLLIKSTPFSLDDSWP